MATCPRSPTSKGQRRDLNPGLRSSETCLRPPHQAACAPSHTVAGAPGPSPTAPPSSPGAAQRRGRVSAGRGRGNQKDYVTQVSPASACPSWANHESCGQRVERGQDLGLARRKSTTVAQWLAQAEGMWTQADQQTLQDRVPLT